jgi:hypothetical protein
VLGVSAATGRGNAVATAAEAARADVEPSRLRRLIFAVEKAPVFRSGPSPLIAISWICCRRGRASLVNQ